jgi:hypothetical protein
MDLGEVLRTHDPHQRMAAIHPMNGNGSVREFNSAPWMSFGDYQQNYYELHNRILDSLRFNKPVVNSEYGYFLRDQSGDGVPDKENSTTIDIMRHATWDLVMAGGYVVTGFGTTYFGGNRDPGPFDVAAEKNKPWEEQIGHLKKLFTAVDWWKLTPHDEHLRCEVPRGSDRTHLRRVAPPEVAYWCLAEPGRLYLVYARGLTASLELTLSHPEDPRETHLLNPRTGEFSTPELVRRGTQIRFRPPDANDWALVLGW